MTLARIVHEAVAAPVVGTQQPSRPYGNVATTNPAAARRHHKTTTAFIPPPTDPSHDSCTIRANGGLMEIGEPAYGEVYNIDSTEEVTIMGLAQRVRALLESSAEIVTVPYVEAYGEGFEDMLRRVPDTSKIHDLIGWETTRSLDDILHDVIAFQQEEAAVV